MNITAKLGNMRKAVEWTVYPRSAMNPRIVTIQSDHRIAHFDVTTGQGMLSQHKASGAYFIHLVREAGAMPVVVPGDVVSAAVAMQPRRGDAIGPGVFVG